MEGGTKVNKLTFIIVSWKGDEKYIATPCRLLRIMNSYGTCPVETLYTSLTSFKGMISVGLQNSVGEIDHVLIYGID
jgi:hypothetical protein